MASVALHLIIHNTWRSPSFLRADDVQSLHRDGQMIGESATPARALSALFDRVRPHLVAWAQGRMQVTRTNCNTVMRLAFQHYKSAIDARPCNLRNFIGLIWLIQ